MSALGIAHRGPLHLTTDLMDGWMDGMDGWKMLEHINIRRLLQNISNMMFMDVLQLKEMGLWKTKHVNDDSGMIGRVSKN